MIDTLFAVQCVLRLLSENVQRQEKSASLAWMTKLFSSNTCMKRTEDLYRIYNMSVKKEACRRIEEQLHGILRIMTKECNGQVPTDLKDRIDYMQSLYVHASHATQKHLDREVHKFLLPMHSSSSSLSYGCDAILSKYADAYWKNQVLDSEEREIHQAYERALLHYNICEYVVRDDTVSNTASLVLALRDVYSYLNVLVPSDALLCMILIFIGEDTSYHAKNPRQRNIYAILGLHEHLQPSHLHEYWPKLLCTGEPNQRLPELLAKMKPLLHESGKDAFKQKLSSIKTHLSQVSRLAHFLLTITTRAPSSHDALMWLQHPVIPNDEPFCLTNRVVRKVMCAQRNLAMWTRMFRKEDTVEMKDAKRVVQSHCLHHWRSSFWHFLEESMSFDENVLVHFPRARKKNCPAWVT